MSPNNSPGRIAVFDMDNTILQGRFIDNCAEQFNFRQALNLLRQIDRNPVSLTVRIASFLKGKTKDELLEIAAAMPLVNDITDVISEMKNRGYLVGIISDSYQLITQYTGDRIGADFWLSNELQFEGRYLTGEVLIPSYFHYSDESVCRHQVCKTNALHYICRKYNMRIENCMAVGDSENDACMIQHAGLGVAFCTTSELLRQAACRHINEKSFRELLIYTEDF